MKKRAVFSTKDIPQAKEALAAAREAGVKNDDISLVARADISLEEIPDEHKDVAGDFYRGAAKGAAGGGAIGLLAGIVAAAIPAVGITVAGALLLTAGGASLGAWSTALSGSASPGPVDRKFEDEIESGRILVIVDEEQDGLDAVKQRVQRTGALLLSFDQPSAIS